MTKRLSDSAVRGREARRKVQVGFPFHFQFHTVEDAKEYLSGSEIQCFLCGRAYKSLAKHLFSIHGISADQYRELYGIPMTFGLVCSETSENHAAVSLKRITEGNLDMHKLADSRKRYKSRQRPLVPCVAKKHGERGRKFISKYNETRRG